MPQSDQVDLFEDPTRALSEVMSRRLDRSPRLWWWTTGPDGAYLLSADGVASLLALRAQLDYWWENQLSPADRSYITQRRHDVLDASYTQKVKAANETESGDPPPKFVIFSIDHNTNTFRLPAEVSAYVEATLRR